MPMAPPVITPPRAERLPYWIVSENRVANLAREIRRASDRESVQVARGYARDFSRDQQFLTLDQLGDVLRAVRFDAARERVLLVLVDSVDQRYGSISSAISAFDQYSSREQARRILNRNDRGDRRDDRYDRRDDRYGDPRHRGPIGRTR